MNSTLEIIAKRRSVRTYSDQPLTQAEKDIILQAAFRAPTAGNMMLYAIIEVEDQALKDRLAHTCDEQPFIAKAPYVLLFLADYQRWMDVYLHYGVERKCQETGQALRNPQEGDLMLACCDALIAAQNAVIAAESLGIGSCYIGDILERCETHRQMFNLPQFVFPITLVCFGRPAAAATGKQTRRFGQEYVVHKNSYRRLSGDEIKEMMAPLEERFSPTPDGPENVGQANYFRKFSADFSQEMSRSVREWLKNWEG